MKKHYLLLPLLITTAFATAQTDSIKSPRVLLEELGRSLDAVSKARRAQVSRLKAEGNKEFIDDGINVKQLVGGDEAGRPLYYTTLNSAAARMVRTSRLYSDGDLGLDISGQGLQIGEWDFSKPRLSHELIMGKVSYPANQNQTISRHSTHIAGTLAGNNTTDAEAAGIASGASIKAYDWIDDASEMAAEAAGGLLVANNSYGFDPIYLQTHQFGKYNQTAQAWDAVMYSAPYFQIVKAAGNSRSIDPQIVPQVAQKNGYDLLEGAGMGKNVLVVGSVSTNPDLGQDSGYTVSGFSSFGPTDDLRIKPDIVAPGEEIYSSIDTYNSAYGTYNGTSSASAVVAGSVLLLQQYWKGLPSHGSYLRSSSVRAILAHTASDTGSRGPDPRNGWGLLNTARAAQLVASNGQTTLIQENTLNQGGTYKIYVVATKQGPQPLVATLAWTDPAGTLPDNAADLATPALVNDLDIRITKVNDSGSSTYFPWRLSSPMGSDAVRNGDNKVDNIEKVEVDNPQGLYQVSISHKGTLSGAKQDYSLIISGISFCYNDDLMILTREKDNIESSGFLGTAQNIRASNVIKSAAQNIVYRAGTSITLMADASGGGKTTGFTVEGGASFHAYIDPDYCSAVDTRTTYTPQSGLPALPPGEYTSAAAPAAPAALEKMRENTSIYPNPASDEVRVKFKIAGSSTVKIDLYDSFGTLVKTSRTSQTFPKGDFVKALDTRNLPTGTYILTIETKEYRETQKLIIK